MSRKRWASWAAVSTLPQAKLVSLEDQLATNREHAARHDGQIVAELVVPGESRSIVLFEDAARKMAAYAQLYELIKARSIDVLVYLDRSRLGRKAALSMAVVELCHEAGIVCYEVENPPSSLDAAEHQSHDEMLLGAIKSVGAQREVQKFTERHRMGMIGRIKAGKLASKPVYGYRIQYNDEGERLVVINEPAAAVVLRLFALYLDGHGTPYIAETFNAECISAPQGGAWQPVNVRSILDNVRRYAGYSEINRRSRRNRPHTLARGKWNPIIDEDMLARIEGERQFRRDNHRVADTPYLLSGVCWCMRCNRRMHVQNFKPMASRKQGARQLLCKTEGHGGLSYRRVLAELRDRMASLDAADLDGMASDLDPLGPTRQRIAALDAQVAARSADLDRADTAFTRGLMSLERYEAQVRRVSAEMEDARLEIERLRQALADEAERGSQRQRLDETAQVGLAMLDNPDAAAANIWLRNHVRVWIDGRRVFAIEWI